METKTGKIKNEIPGVRYDPEMDKYDNIILFPEKLAQAEEDLRNSNLIEFINELEKRKEADVKK